MAKYVVLIPCNEDTWDATPQEEKERVYNAHMEFAKLLAERGHSFVEGAELVRSDQARIVSGSLDDRTTEFADHLHEHFVHPAVVRGGHYLLPSAAGYSVDLGSPAAEAIWVVG